MGIFSVGIIYNNLMKEQKGLINNNYSVHIKLVNYFYGLKYSVKVSMQSFSTFLYENSFI
jgi:hypothetical protein